MSEWKERTSEQSNEVIDATRSATTMTDTKIINNSTTLRCLPLFCLTQNNLPHSNPMSQSLSSYGILRRRNRHGGCAMTG
jgi:hypothetical protein